MPTRILKHPSRRHQSSSASSADPRRLARAVEILRILSRSGLRELLAEPGTEAQARAHARQFRAGLEELGPTFCKLGQLLSTRPDILPLALVEELSSLRSHVPSMATSEVLAVVDEELGRPWQQAFASIDPEPLAAGTVAQVHRARLADGREVVLKVQRPTAAAVIERDIALLRSVVRGVGHRRRLAAVLDLPAIVEQLAASLTTELDFGREAVHLERMQDVLAAFPLVAVPRCHRTLSSRRVLVMDDVGGVPIDEIEVGPACTAPARELLAAFFHQILTAGFFHADPHPGNILWADGKIWLVDFGMVGEVDPADRRRLGMLLLAFWQGDAGFVTDLVLGSAGPTAIGSVDIDAFRADIAALIRSAHEQRTVELEIGPLLQRITEISIRHGVPVPTALVMVGKTLAQVQYTVANLSPDLDLFDEARRHFVRDLTERLRPAGDVTRWAYEAVKVHHRLVGLVEVLSHDGRLLRREDQVRTDLIDERLVRAARGLTFGFVGGCTIVAAGLVAGARRLPRTASS